MAITAPPDLDLSLAGWGEEQTDERAWLDHLSAWLAWLQPHLPAQLQAGAYTLGLTLCDDEAMAALNQQWRGQQGSTDVLAFAVQDVPIPEPRPEGEPLELGDIVISRETAARQATEAGQPLERELLFLASHGLLHLLGWDHPDEPSLAAMLQRQDDLLSHTAHLPLVAPDPCEGESRG